MLLVVASMKVELEGLFGLDKSPDHWSDCRLSYTGIGRENVDRTFDSLNFDTGPDGLLSVGFVGSVDPKVKPGDICLLDTVEAQDVAESFHPNESFRALAERVLGENCRTCGLLTLNSTASDTREKRSFQDRDFSVIDRETYWVAARAREEDVPFLGMRVVIDGIDQELPPESCYDSDTGEVRPGKFTSWLVKNPFKVGDLPRLGWNSVRARRRLGEAINRVVPALLE